MVAHRHGAALAALHAVIQADRRRPRGGVLARQADDLFRGDAGEFRRALRRPLADALAQLVEAFGVVRHVVRVVQALADDDVHHGQRQRRIAARIDEEVLVRRRAGAVAVRIDDVKLRAVAPRLHDERPEMDVRAEMFAPQAMISLECRNCSGSVA